MIDTLLANREKARQSTILDTLGLEENHYGVVTLHRPSNVDHGPTLMEIFGGFETIQRDMPLVFPMHPRTRGNLSRLGLEKKLSSMNNLKLIEPVGYLDFLRLMSSAFVVLTDSGGIQEETTILGVPCLTLRENTERPVTITEGTNRLVHVTAEDIRTAYNDIKAKRNCFGGRTPKFWDGQAARRIAEGIARHFGKAV